MKKKLTIIFFFLFSLFLTGQQASRELGGMPDAVFETSGLIFYNGKLVTHNDSDNTPQLFEIDTVSLEVTRTITLTNVENTDWEDIAQDEEYIYVGDFGNNRGNRQDLAIYRITKADYSTSEDVVAEIIGFTYEDQTDFEDNANNDWDAEALFVLNDQLVILTKQWKSEGTVAYALPKIPGNQTAKRLDSYDTQGLVTGATYNPISESLYIIGYSKVLQPFLIRVDGLKENVIFGGTITRTNFEISRAQVEGIAYVDADTYYFSSEFFRNENPPIVLASLLFSFNARETTEQEEEEEEVESENPEENPVLEENKKKPLLLYRKFRSDKLNYRLNIEGEIYGVSIFDISGHHVLRVPFDGVGDSQIDVSMLRSTIYYFTVFTANGMISKPFVRE